jgi:hypothetical protein
MGLVANVKPVFDISYHSYSELVLYPYGCQGQRTETHQIISILFDLDEYGACHQLE